MFRSFSSLPRSVVLRVSNRNLQVRASFQCDLSEKWFIGCVISQEIFSVKKKNTRDFRFHSDSYAAIESRESSSCYFVDNHVNCVLIVNFTLWLTPVYSSLSITDSASSEKESSSMCRAKACQRLPSTMCRTELVSFRVIGKNLEIETIRQFFSSFLYLQNI